MSDEINVDKAMDLSGLACPMPVVKVSKGIRERENRPLFNIFIYPFNQLVCLF